jgi:dihydroxy-acid dehydratase
MKMLLDEGLLPRRLHDRHRQDHGGEPQERAANIPRARTIVRGFDNPIKPSGHLVVFRGNLCPGGAVAKISGKEGLVFEGKAICSNRGGGPQGHPEGKVKKGHVIVIRYEGPKGGPGMREMLSPTSAIMGKGLGQGRRAHHGRTL